MPRKQKKKANSKNLKKTSKLGAYALARKKQLAIRRNPLTEQKTRTIEDLVDAVPSYPLMDTLQEQALTATQGYSNIQLPVINYMVQGLGEPEMIGRSIFAKYMTLKIEFRFPQGVANEGQNNVLSATYAPRELYLIHGFIKTSPNLTPTSDVTPDKFEWLKSVGADDDAMNLWVSAHVQSYFNERTDKLQFIPKQNSPLKILKYQKIVPDLSKQWDAPLRVQSNTSASEPDNYFTAGAIPLVNRTIQWPMMRKYHYEKGTAMDPATDADFYYPNTNQWIPFCAVYNPMFAEYGETAVSERVQIRSNQILYYTDS